MIRVEVTNRFSDHHGKIGYVSIQEWKRDSYWVTLSINGQMTTTARMYLVEV